MPNYYYSKRGWRPRREHPYLRGAFYAVVIFLAFIAMIFLLYGVQLFFGGSNA